MGKKKSGKKGSGKGKKDKGEKKKKARPTRCPPDFRWEKQPLLVEAAQMNDPIRVRKLIERGEDVSRALHYAIGRGRLRTVEMLIEAGADLHTEIVDGDYWIPPPADPASAKKGKKGKKSGKKGKKKK